MYLLNVLNFIFQLIEPSVMRVAHHADHAPPSTSNVPLTVQVKDAAPRTDMRKITRDRDWVKVHLDLQTLGSQQTAHKIWMPRRA